MMRSTRFTVFGIVMITIFGFTACDVTEEVIDGNVEPSKHLEIKEINQAVLTGNGDEPVGFEIGYVVQSQEEWQSLRKKMNAVNHAQGEISIDFEQSTVLAYFDKIRPNGGYSIEIVQVIESDQNINVMYTSNAPTGMATDIMTQPFHIVRIPKASKTVEFRPITE